MSAPSDDDVGLAERLLAACRASGRTLATAESCTGGLVAHLLTEVPGSSDVFLGGVVSYADDVKRHLLSVPASLLEAHGAVSEPVAVAMADGVRTTLGASLAVAVTGIAGPSGGSATKPVGLVYVAVSDDEGHRVEEHRWSGDRSENKRRSAEAALRLLAARLEP